MTSANNDRIDLIILTGFLGSGKTTLLNGMLRDPSLSDAAVIVNEFGEIGLDHLLVQSASGDVVLLESGCLCCAAGDSFADTLLDLWVKRERGEVPRFKRVIVETSGLAEPFPLVVAVMKTSLINMRYRYAGTITTYDAVFGARTLRDHREAREQLQGADVVVLTKADVDGVDLNGPQQQIRSLNAHAPVFHSSTAAFPIAQVLDQLKPNHSGHGCTLHGHSGHDHAASGYQHSLTLNTPITWQAIAAFADQLKNHAPTLLRCKGLLFVQGEHRPVLFQAVRNIVETERLQDWTGESRVSQLTLIFFEPSPPLATLLAPLHD